MKILAIDCTASPASAAIVEDGKTLSSAYTNIGLTHSQTLIPMVNSVLSNAKISLDDIDYFAINAGPGSFTGVRIGVAALKGLTLFRGDCIVSVSTLGSMAYNYYGVSDLVVCGTMDARCKQVYTARFAVSDSVERLVPDSAIAIEELKKQLQLSDKKTVLVGDGAALCYNVLGSEVEHLSLAPEQLRYQNAVSVARCAEDKLKHGYQPISSEALLPVYLRAPQAERQLKKKRS